MTITLKTLQKATAQEVFNQVSTHLLKQKETSWRNGGTACAYKSGNLKCAAGCLIADDEYDAEKFEDKPWDFLRIHGVVPKKHSQLIYDLQIIHDTSRPAHWLQGLLDVAKKHKLNASFLKD